MSDTQTLIFQEITQGDSSRTRCWIHPNGRSVTFAALAPGAETALLERCDVWLEERLQNSDALTSDRVVLELRELLGGDPGRVSILACELEDKHSMRCSMIAEPSQLRLLEVDDARRTPVRDRAEDVFVQARAQRAVGDVATIKLALPVDKQVRYLIAERHFDVQKIAAQRDLALDASSAREWKAFAQATATHRDFRFVVFPAHGPLTHRSPVWPYDPFESEQESLKHERVGLARLASALFLDKTFHGFRIARAPSLFTEQSTRAFDGVLVSPWGVVLLELKDHRGRVALDRHRYEDGFQHWPTWPQTHGYHTQENPIQKLDKILKRRDEFKAVTEAIGRDPTSGGWLSRLGAVVFTNPDVKLSVEGISRAQGVTALGPVLVTRPHRFAGDLRDKLASVRVHEPLLNAAKIERVVGRLTGAAKGPEARSGMRAIGRYRYSHKPIAENAFFSVYPGEATATGTAVWIKRFEVTHLGRATKAGEPMPALVLQALRGSVALQEKLPADPRLQRALDSVQVGDDVFAIVQPVEAPALADWLAQGPIREERLQLLQQIAEVLVLLARHEVTHRALSPLTIRVRGGVPVLTDFDLCRIDGVATLPATGRALLDLAYLAPEASRPGAEIGPAADVYSFGRIACQALANKLPFANYLEQGRWARSPEAYEQLARDCGLADPHFLRRMLSPAPQARATASEIVAWMQTL